MDVPPELAEMYAHEAVRKNPGEKKPMKLVRDALALYEADVSKKADENGTTAAAPKKRKGRLTKAEKAKADDPEDLRNTESYAEMKEKDGGNA